MYIDKIKVINIISKQGKLFEITVNGTSMLPLIKNEAIVSIKRMSTYKKGDIILYKYLNEGMLLHRIVRINKDKYICKGDNCYRLETIDNDQIFGKLIFLNASHTTQAKKSSILRKNLLCFFSYRIGKIVIQSNMDIASANSKFIFRIYRRLVSKFACL